MLSTASTTARPLIRKGTCSICRIPASSRCSSCKLVNYCCRDHQLADFSSHKTICKKVNSLKRKTDQEERLLRQKPADGFLWPGWDRAMGHFWGLMEPRDYMRAKQHWILALMEMDNEASLEVAMSEGFDCMRINRADNQGIRTLLTHIMFRLRKFQKAYDFMRFWMKDKGDDYDIDDLSSPYLDIVNAPICAPVDFGRAERTMGVFTTLLMLNVRRVFLDYLNLYLILPPNIPESTVGSVIRDHLIEARVSKPLMVDFQATTPSEILPILKKLHKNVLDAYLYSERWEHRLWPLLSNHEELDHEMKVYATKPVSFDSNAYHYLYPSYQHWKESPWAIDVVVEITRLREYDPQAKQTRWKGKK
ncbi:hypothetical protein HDU96_004176 [Phlyctochytrium bullatum]|nr:hypothetical protein HDU96_004176 [Phlyctochytrium bullatum]